MTSEVDRALRAREIADMAIVVRAVAPRTLKPRRRAYRQAVRQTPLYDSCVDLTIGERRPSWWQELWQDRAWRFVIVAIILVAVLWLSATLSGHAPTPGRP